MRDPEETVNLKETESPVKISKDTNHFRIALALIAIGAASLLISYFLGASPAGPLNKIGSIFLMFATMYVLMRLAIIIFSKTGNKNIE